MIRAASSRNGYRRSKVNPLEIRPFIELWLMNHNNVVAVLKLTRPSKILGAGGGIIGVGLRMCCLSSANPVRP